MELISNEKNQKLKLEKNIILKDVGAFSVQKYKSYLRNSINKITATIKIFNGFNLYIYYHFFNFL
jgi:hypothetical protein